MDDDDEDDQSYARRLMSRLRLSSDEAERALDLVARRTDINRQEEERLRAVRQEAHEMLLTSRRKLDHQFYQNLLDRHIGDVMYEDSVAGTANDARVAMEYWILCGLDPKILDEDWVPSKDYHRQRSDSHGFLEQASTQADSTQGASRPSSTTSPSDTASSSKARAPPQVTGQRHSHQRRPPPTTPALLPPAIITPSNTKAKKAKSQPQRHPQQQRSEQTHETPVPLPILGRNHQTITPPEPTSTTPQQLISPPKSSHAHPSTTRYTPIPSHPTYATTTTPSISASTSAFTSTSTTPHFPTQVQTQMQTQSNAQSRTYSHPWFSLDPTAFSHSHTNSHSHSRSHHTTTFPPAHPPTYNNMNNESANAHANITSGRSGLGAAAMTPEATPTRGFRGGDDTNASGNAKEERERVEVRINEMRTPVGEGTPSRKAEKVVGKDAGKDVEKKKRGVGRPRKRVME